MVRSKIKGTGFAHGLARLIDTTVDVKATRNSSYSLRRKLKKRGIR